MSRDLLGKVIMHALELQRLLNRAIAVVLYYHPCGDPYKSPEDHIDEVYAFLKDSGEIKEKEYYNESNEFFEMVRKKKK